MSGHLDPSPAWAAVVVHYFSGPLLAECVAALLADTSAGPVDVVVVDNGSDTGSDPAGSAASLLASFPDVTVLRPGANLGYARAANLGIAATRTPIVGVFNPDALVAPGSAAAVFDAFARDEAIAIVGPRILNPDGSVYPSARTAPGPMVAAGHAVLGGVVPRNRFTTAYRQLDADPASGRDVDWVSGAALWFRRTALDRAGGWDERFFLFMEDIDVCRVVRAGGGKVRYEPRATVMHVVGTSRAAQPMRSIALHHRAAYRYLDKWWTGPRRLALPVAGGFLGARAGWAIAAARVRTRRGFHRHGSRVETG
jgi:N-acetylglucosaminyl-diphospho-decaprenol L-rhamnosyltransferase